MMNNTPIDFEKIKEKTKKLSTSEKINLNDLVDHIGNNKARLKPNCLTEKGAIYSFWWTGSIDLFKEKSAKNIVLFGPSKKKILLSLSDNWIDQYGEFICLYVGKTSSGLKSRIGQHLRLGNIRESKLGNEVLSESYKPPTTSCQLKIGLEKLFPTESNIRELMLKNVSLSFVELDDDQEAGNRFYIEDRAIGEFFPIINLDVER